MVDRAITECVNGKWLAQAPSSTQRAAVSAVARIGLNAVGVSLTGWIVAAEAQDATSSGWPVVVKRNPAYRELLSQAWRFDDVSSAVGMIRELSEPQLRRRRLQDQFTFLDELRKHSPDQVIAAVYREVVKG